MKKNKERRTWNYNQIIFPLFLENEELPPSYYEAPDPYKSAPSCNVNLLELSRYARKIGKKLIELTKEEVLQFAI